VPERWPSRALSATAHGSLWPSKDLLGRALPNLSVNKQAALTTVPRPEAAPTTPPASSPRQVLVVTLTQTIAAAHAAGDLAIVQSVARILSEFLSALLQTPRVAPNVDRSSARCARSRPLPHLVAACVNHATERHIRSPSPDQAPLDSRHYRAESRLAQTHHQPS
jgi:hypothetical protein